MKRLIYLCLVGLVFASVASAAPIYHLTTLVTFNGANGKEPYYGALIADASGNLYGTTYIGGANNKGTVFEVANDASHTLSTLATFNGANGANPHAGLIADASGNLYSTTATEGPSGRGTVFELVNDVNHTLTTLASFSDAIGSIPVSGLLADASGNLFGTTANGGANGHGTVFEVAAGTHSLSTLFTFNGTNGNHPYAGLIADASGNLYGTTSGATSGYGTVFELSPVPEPSTFVLAAVGVFGLVMFRRRRSRFAPQFKVAVTFFACATFQQMQTVAHAAPVRTVALIGQQAPGTPSGVNYSGFTAPLLNDAGRTAFIANLTGSGVDSTNNTGIWSEGSGSLALVARQGSQAPGTPSGVNYSQAFTSLVLNDAGQTAFYATNLTGSGVVSGVNDGGIWSDRSGSLALVVRKGDHAPGTPSGVNYSAFFMPVLNDAGQTAFFADLTGSGVMTNINDRGIWSEGSGNLALVARSGQPAPGTTDGVNYLFTSNSRPPVLNDAGQTAFIAFLIGGAAGTTGTNSGIWSECSGGPVLVARSGDHAPGTSSGVNYSGVAPPALNNAGQTAFVAVVIGSGVDSSNNRGIWSEGSGSLALVARTGSQAPGTPGGVNFMSFSEQTVLNDAGQTAFFANLTGSSVDSTNDQGIWSEGFGSLALVAREGSQAPGTPSGVNFSSGLGVSSSAKSPVLNDAGQTAFFADLTGSGVDSNNNTGIWATDRTAALQLIAREGDLLEVAPGDFRTISGLTFVNGATSIGNGTGNSDGRPSGFNDLGQLAFQATFTDGSSGVFVSNLVAVPEPSTFVLTVVGLSFCVLRRQRSHNECRNAARTNRVDQQLSIALALSFCAAALFGLQSQSARADSAVAWGTTFRGALGNGITVTSSQTPVPVSGMDSGVTAIAAGYQYSLAVQNGGAFAWGENIVGQLGDGTLTNRNTPVSISGLASGVTAVSASGFGNDHSLAIQNGALYAWGVNGGMLGDGTTTSRVTPVPVIGMDSGVTAVAAGAFFSLAVKNGGLFAWGFNSDGILGDGTTTDRVAPVPVIGMANGITAIAAGHSHSLAVKDGGVYAWGQNVAGVLGNGIVGGFSSNPALVSGLEHSATAVAVGEFHSLAVVNGAVYAWGENQFGLLGDGFTDGFSSTPVQVYPTILTNIVAVAAEGPQIKRDFALSIDGSLWSWGNTTGGNLQHMLPPAGFVFTSIDAGRSHVVATLAAVPEPSSLLLAALAAAGLLWRRRGLLCAAFLAAAVGATFADRAAADTFGSGANTFNIDFVSIGNPGNAADTTGAPNPAGSVPYTYRMDKFEISEQMIDKANTLGGLGITKDTRGPDKPATSTSWNEAARFVNWLNTSTGSVPAYKFAIQPGGAGYSADANIQLWTPGDAGYNPNNLYRNSLARYVLPSVDEWYKGAYYDPTSGVYFDYATGSDSVPTAVASGTAAGTAVYGQAPGTGSPADITLAGGLSPYGTMGQGGNVLEWEETDFDLVNDLSSNRGYRGGGWSTGSFVLSSSFRNNVISPSLGTTTIGFRVASTAIPEPSTLLLAVLAAAGLLWRTRVSYRHGEKTNANLH